MDGVRWLRVFIGSCVFCLVLYFFHLTIVRSYLSVQRVSLWSRIQIATFSLLAPPRIFHRVTLYLGHFVNAGGCM